MLFLAQSKEITVLYVMHDFDIGSMFIYIYDLHKSNDLVNLYACLKVLFKI